MDQPLLLTHPRPRPIITATDSKSNKTTTSLTFRTTHFNVQLICLFSLLFHCGWSIWERNIFPVWLVNSLNTTDAQAKQTLGFIQTIQGITALIVGPMIGTLVDTIQTTNAFRWFQMAVVVEGLVALTVVGYSIYNNHTNWVLFVAMSLWGTLLSGQGILVETLIARSTTKGKERTFGFTLKSTWWRCGNAIGQLINVGVLYFVGNNWTPAVLRFVMLVGIALLYIPVVLLGCLRPLVEHTEVGETGGEDAGGKDAAAEEAGATEKAGNALRRQSCCSCCRPPWIIFVAVLLRVIGKGSSMKFIPIYFEQVYNVSPMTLTLLALAAQCCSIFSPFGCLYLSRIIGRAPTMVFVRCVEPVCFLIFAWSNNVYVCGCAFVCFLSIPVGTRSIEKAVLNDYAMKKRRARWNALETINRGTWSGSATLGGYLAALTNGWQLLFSFAAGSVGSAVLVLSLLLGVVRN